MPVKLGAEAKPRQFMNVRLLGPVRLSPRNRSLFRNVIWFLPPPDAHEFIAGTNFDMLLHRRAARRLPGSFKELCNGFRLDGTITYRAFTW
jgi:hypothetical protein